MVRLYVGLILSSEVGIRTQNRWLTPSNEYFYDMNRCRLPLMCTRWKQILRGFKQCFWLYFADDDGAKRLPGEPALRSPLGYSGGAPSESFGLSSTGLA